MSSNIEIKKYFWYIFISLFLLHSFLWRKEKNEAILKVYKIYII